MKNIKAQREAKLKSALSEADDMRDMYRNLFFSEVGKKVLLNLMAICGEDTDAFNENPNTMAYVVGRQSIAKHIKLMLKEKK